MVLGRDHRDFRGMEDSNYASLSIIDKYRISSLASFIDKSV